MGKLNTKEVQEFFMEVAANTQSTQLKKWNI